MYNNLICTILASTAACEISFSTTGHVIHDGCTCLKPSTVDSVFFDVITSLKSDRHVGYQDANGDVTFAG